jgi:hypothetical protein
VFTVSSVVILVFTVSSEDLLRLRSVVHACKQSHVTLISHVDNVSHHTKAKSCTPCTVHTGPFALCFFALNPQCSKLNLSLLYMRRMTKKSNAARLVDGKSKCMSHTPFLLLPTCRQSFSSCRNEASQVYTAWSAQPQMACVIQST